MVASTGRKWASPRLSGHQGDRRLFRRGGRLRQLDRRLLRTGRRVRHRFNQPVRIVEDVGGKGWSDSWQRQPVSRGNGAAWLPFSGAPPIRMVTLDCAFGWASRKITQKRTCSKVAVKGLKPSTINRIRACAFKMPIRSVFSGSRWRLFHITDIARAGMSTTLQCLHLPPLNNHFMGNSGDSRPFSPFSGMSRAVCFGKKTYPCKGCLRLR